MYFPIKVRKWKALRRQSLYGKTAEIRIRYNDYSIREQQIRARRYFYVVQQLLLYYNYFLILKTIMF